MTTADLHLPSDTGRTGHGRRMLTRLSHRLSHRLSNEGRPKNLPDMLCLDDETLAWAKVAGDGGTKKYLLRQAITNRLKGKVNITRIIILTKYVKKAK